MVPFTLKSYEFRREREAVWHELEALVVRVERRGIQYLSAEELHRLPALYRASLSSLSVARAISLDKNVVHYLETLSARAYVCVYSTRRRGWQAVAEFFRSQFPELVWQMRRGLWLATALLVLGTAVGFAMTAADPERFYTFVDPAMAGGRGPTSSREELLSVLRDSGGGATAHLSEFASFLFTHNAKIGLTCVAFGFLAGVPVILMLFINGLTLGAMIGIHWQKGLTLEFVAWVMPHGVTELLAVCLCGAAGFAIGQSLVFPGVYRRLENLAQRGRAAGAVAVGGVALFFIAALIEGFFRQLVHDTLARAAVAILTGLLWFAYFARGRPRGVRAPGGLGVVAPPPAAPVDVPPPSVRFRRGATP